MLLGRAFKVFLIASVIFAFATAAYAFAAGNTVPRGKAGSGGAVINSYAVVAGSIHYILNASNPQTIDSVSFTTTTSIPGGSTVRAKLVTAGFTWYSCTVAAGTNVTCTTTGAPVGTADSLRVVIAD
jgi:hypothetical protein